MNPHSLLFGPVGKVVDKTFFLRSFILPCYFLGSLTRYNEKTSTFLCFSTRSGESWNFHMAGSPWWTCRCVKLVFFFVFSTEKIGIPDFAKRFGNL